jgi:hypothetical protein
MLEALETRNCLSTPSIIAFSASPLAGHAAQLSGTVTDDDPSGVTLNFSGAAAGSVRADPTGHFSFISHDPTLSLGTVYAWGTNQQGTSSNTMSSVLTLATPTVSVSARAAGQHMVTLTGSVSDLDLIDQQVIFSGVVGASANTDADGNYSVTTTAQNLGTIQATARNLWGLSSNVAVAVLNNNAPAISDFRAVRESGDMVTFSGKVTDESATAVSVTLGGLPSLNNEQVLIACGGTFESTFLLRTGESGTATAQTTNGWGQSSDVATALVP